MPESIDDALRMSDAELFASIGEALEGGRMGPQDALQREGIGRRFFASLKPRICQAICNKQIAAIFSEPSSTEDLAAVIFDTLRALVGLSPDGIPLFTIAVLAARSYSEMCGTPAKLT